MAVFEITKKPSRLVAATAAALFAMGPAAFAQTPTDAKIHGHVTDPTGQTLASGQVKFTKDLTTPFKDEKFTNTAPIGADGNYAATGVAPGEYFIYVIQNDKTLDRMQVVVKAGDDKPVDFDMSRADYLSKLTPEERKALEEYKTKNAAAQSANKQVAGLNATMTAVRADLKTPSPNFDKDATDSKDAIAARPTEPLLWVLQGDVLSARADSAASADRKNKVSPTTDDAVTKGYADAIDSYKKAQDLMTAAGAKPSPSTEATVYNEMGNTLAKSGNIPDASAAYDKAVTLEPQNAGMFYANEAAVLFNARQPALDAANKAIAADPTKANPYFIKGQELLNKATVDKAGKIVPPPGCVDAYQKYLELAPDGPQAAGVKDTLTALGEKVQTHYSAKKGK